MDLWLFSLACKYARLCKLAAIELAEPDPELQKYIDELNSLDVQFFDLATKFEATKNLEEKFVLYEDLQSAYTEMRHNMGSLAKEIHGDPDYKYIIQEMHLVYTMVNTKWNKITAEIQEFEGLTGLDLSGLLADKNVIEMKKKKQEASKRIKPKSKNAPIRQYEKTPIELRKIRKAKYQKLREKINSMSEAERKLYLEQLAAKQREYLSDTDKKIERLSKP